MIVESKVYVGNKNASNINLVVHFGLHICAKDRHQCLRSHRARKRSDEHFVEITSSRDYILYIKFSCQ